jgi:hypothetical protein
MYFGRIFGVRAIVESGMLSREHTTAEDCDRLVSDLVEYANAKFYLREACFDIIISIFQLILSGKPKHHLKDHAQACLQKALPNGVTSAEELWLVLELQRIPNNKVGCFSNHFRMTTSLTPS